MIAEYIKAAMRGAHYEKMEDGRWFATIPACECLWADGDTVEFAREELESRLEGWILLGLHHGHTLPVIAGLDLNPQPAYAETY